MADPIVPGQRRPTQTARAVAGIAALTADSGPIVVAIGVFDGLHRGHLYLLRQLRLAARRRGARPAVITFDAHPREVISGTAPPLLCDPDERLVRLAAAGAELIVVQHFDDTLRHTSYRDFVASIRERVELRGFLMTPDAAFGYERQGTPERLATLGESWDFAVDVVPPLLVDGRQVRSSEIRQVVADGRLAAARRLLGRAFSLVGERPIPAVGALRADLFFPVPFALPPSGRYQVAVGPAWQPGDEPQGASCAAVATVRSAPAGVRLDSASELPATRRLRVVFVRRLASRSAAASVASWPSS